MTDAISILFLALSAIPYAISQLQQQGKIRWSKSADGFWGNESDKRKYKRPLKPAPLTAYYKYNDLAYVEKFPGSGSIGVFLTDGYHLMQFCFLALISISIGLQFYHWILMSLAARACFGLVFTLAYKWAGR